MIVLQNKITRDIVGLANAFSSIGKNVHLWDTKQEDFGDFKDVELLILVEMDGTLGYKTINSIPKDVPVVLLHIEQMPKLFAHKKNARLVDVPLCTDDVYYFPGFYRKDLACDITYISNVTADENSYIVKTLGKLSSKKYKLRFVGDVRLPLVPYMGRIDREDIISLCKSSKLCIDFNFNAAIDLIYHGCNVVTSIENDIIPYFNDGNFLEVVDREMSKSQPIIDDRKDKLGIIPYSHFAKELLK